MMRQTNIPAIAALLTLVIVPTLALFGVGCGGNQSKSGVSSPIATGRATLTVRWPERSRLIPFAAESINVRIAHGSQLYGEKLLTRPANGGTASVTFDQIPTGGSTVSAVAFPNADGTGTAQARGQANITVNANQTTDVHLTLASTISRLTVDPATLSLQVGENVTPVATALDSQNEIVLTQLATYTWTSDHTDIASVEAGGKMSGVAAGTATVTVTETESGKKASIPVTVTPVPATFSYHADFENSSAGPEWSSQNVDVTPVGGRHFLGQFAGNQSVRLSLSGLATHKSVTVSFDLYVIRSWDGSDTVSGPDVWSLGVVGGATLLKTTFSNYNGTNGIFLPQHYPDSYPGTSTHPGRTGAVENDTLGYFNGQAQDAVYHLTFTFDHTGGDLSLEFAGQNLQDVNDESWGLDNVDVQTNP